MKFTLETFKNLLICVGSLIFTAVAFGQATICELDEPIRGITLGMQAKTYDYDYNKELTEIKATGAPWVCLTFKFYTAKVNSTDFFVYENDFESYWEELDVTIQQAKALNLKVMLLPIIIIKDPEPGEWRGKLMPDDPDEWFVNYGKLYEQITGIAEKNNVEMISIGSELASLQGLKIEWTELIHEVSKSYSGMLTYSANWDAFEDVAFLDQLDLLGISSYFSLTEKDNPSIKEIEAEWKNIQAVVTEEMALLSVPFMFSEVGYASKDGINKNPWDYTLDAKLDLKEQEDCFIAFTNVWEDDENLKGVFFYEWYGDGGGKKDKSYTMKGKPALDVIKTWFN